MVDILMFYCKEMTLSLASLQFDLFAPWVSKNQEIIFFNIDNGKYINVFGNIGTI